jgi:hypothetical protein
MKEFEDLIAEIDGQGLYQVPNLPKPEKGTK